MRIRCKRPKLELLHGPDYEEGKKRVDNYKLKVFGDSEPIMVAWIANNLNVTEQGDDDNNNNNNNNNNNTIQVPILD
ncbi:MAG: hypothetical protein ACRD8W_00125 [Nitrososphaeraceae archaeon]